MNRLTLSQMRAFEAVARTGSVTDAARDLGMSQPSISTQVRAAENHARTPLFTRVGKRFVLTELGHEVFQKVCAALALVDDVDQLLENQRLLHSGLLRIGYSAHQFTMPLISEYAARHPGIRIEARCMATDDLLQRVNRNLMDVAMITTETTPQGLYSQLYSQERVVLMVPQGHPLAAHADTGVDWQALENQSIVRREVSSGTRRIFENAAAKQGVVLHSMFDVGSWSSMADAVHAGIGIGIALEGELPDGPDVVAVPIRDPNLAAGHYIVTPQNMETVASIQAFFELAQELAGPATHGPVS